MRRRFALVALVVALVTPVSAARSGAATEEPDGAWKLASTTVNPTNAPSPVSYRNLQVAAGHVSWTFTDEDPTYAANYDIRYDKLPEWLEADTLTGVSMTVRGTITAGQSQRFTGAAVTLVINRSWDKTVGVEQNCRWVSAVPGTPPRCDAPATTTGVLTYTPPRGTTSGTSSTYDVTVGVLNCAACAVTFHYTWWEDSAPGRTSKTKRGSNDATNPSDERLPVIVLPGVGGTSLNATGRVLTTEVWPFALAGGRDGMALEPDGMTPANGASITTGDILMGGGPLDYFADTYGPLVGYLESEGYRQGVDLYTFPYDWRLDNATHLSALDRLVDRALSRSSSDHVVLVAHSMGGLIARSYVLSSKTRAAKVDSLITLGTPYWGSPKVFYAFVQGYTFGNPTVEQSLMKLLVQNFPAAYQLLPQYKFVRTLGGGAVSLGHTYTLTYPGLMRMPTGEYRPDPSQPWSLNIDLLGSAVEFWRASGTLDRPTRLRVDHHVIIGTGVRTLAGYTLREDPAGLAKTDRGVRVSFVARYGDGDGTVPLQGSEVAGANRTYYVPWSAEDSTEHGDLPGSARVQEIVGQILGGEAPGARQHRYPGSRGLHYNGEGDLSF